MYDYYVTLGRDRSRDSKKREVLLFFGDYRRDSLLTIFVTCFILLQIEDLK